MSDNHDTASMQDHIRVYLMVFGALGVLTIITVLASYLNLSTSEGIFLALIIASIKASLVLGYFMHLISEKKNDYLDSFAYSFFLFCNDIFTFNL